MKRLIYILLFVVAGQLTTAQQLPLHNQYLYNKFLINPAYAGSDGYTSLNITAREQWLGHSGAPRTYSVSWQTRVIKKNYRLKQTIFNRTVYRPKTDGKVGFGGYVSSDKNGLIQKTGFQASYSYHMWLNDYTQLSMGLAFTGYHFIINASALNFDDPNEPWLNNDLRKGVFIADGDFGVYLLNPRYDVGFSALQMFGAAAKIGNKAYDNYHMDRHYYLFGSYNFYSGTNTEFQPSLLFKISEQFWPQADIGITYIYDQRFWAGLSFRTAGALIGNFRFKLVPGRVKQTTMYLGYAFDFTLNKIQRATFGTHEVTIALKFGDSMKRYRWLERF